MFFTVYQITNKTNGKIYIGKHQTKDLNDGYMGSGKRLHYAIEKYGIENFEKEILFQFDNEVEMNLKEAELVTKEFCLREDTYNLCPGGKGGFGYINSKGMNVEHEGNFKNNKVLAISAGDKGRSSMWNLPPKEQEEFNRRRSETKKKTMGDKYFEAHFAGRKHSEETKAKMRKSKNVGNANSQYGTMWITNGEQNKKIKKEDSIPNGWRRGMIVKS